MQECYQDQTDHCQIYTTLVKNTEAKIKCKEGIWKKDMVDDLREQLEIDMDRSLEYKTLLEPVREKKTTN